MNISLLSSCNIKSNTNPNTVSDTILIEKEIRKKDKSYNEYYYERLVVERKFDTLLFFKYFTDSVKHRNFTLHYSDTIPLVKILPLTRSQSIIVEQSVIDTIHLSIEGIDHNIFKILNDDPESSDDETYIFIHEQYGELFNYSIAWGGFSFISKASDKKLTAVAKKLKHEILSNKEKHLK